MRARRRCGRQRKYNDSPIVPLGELSAGEAGTVVKICCRAGARRRRLFDMGITVGTVIAVKQIAPLGDPVEVALRDYWLCLRRDDLDLILVEVVE